MQITVFGASGRVGQLVVQEALAQGYSVVAFVHHKNPFHPKSGLKICKGSIENTESITRALEGSEAVISTLGSWHSHQKNVVSAGTAALIPAMTTAGIRRIITVTGNGAFTRNDSPTMMDRLGRLIIKSVGKGVVQDGEAHLRLLAASLLDWTCIRSPAMIKGDQLDYSLDMTPTSSFATIPRKAVARAIVDQINDTSYLGAAPFISRGRSH